MKQFAEIALASFVGVAIFNVVDVMGEVMINVYRKRKHRDHWNSKNPQKADYSPDVSGRRTIGFKMRGEE